MKTGTGRGPKSSLGQSKPHGSRLSRDTSLLLCVIPVGPAGGSAFGQLGKRPGKAGLWGIYFAYLSCVQNKPR